MERIGRVLRPECFLEFPCLGVVTALGCALGAFSTANGQTPDWNRGVRRIMITPGAELGFHDLQAEVVFESGDTGRKPRDLSVEVRFAVNGSPIAARSEPFVIDPGSGAGCSTPPCGGNVCGHAALAAFRVEIHCRESFVCDHTPTFCDCRCGGVRLISGPFDHPLSSGDQVSVSLAAMPGAENDLFNADDILSVPFADRVPSADFDGDNVRTLADHAVLQECMFGPKGTVDVDCREGDLDQSGTVDLADFARFQLGFSGAVVPCAAEGLRLDWPLLGRDARQWVIHNHVDLQRGPGTIDYVGNMGDAAKTYDEHKGVDLDVPTFRAMDLDFPVLAAAAGYAVLTHDGEFDRNTACAGTWNVMHIEHANGFTTVYGHLKRESVVVNVGDFVLPGQKIAVVGSSGCSTRPQIHFEVRDCTGAAIDPFSFGMWRAPPDYATPLGFMDATLQEVAIVDVVQIVDPPPNVTTIFGGETLGIGVSAAGGQPGDTFTVEILKQDGSAYETATWLWDRVLRHSFWFENVVINPSPGESGVWRIRFLTNGTAVAEQTLNVEAGEGARVEPGRGE